MSSLKLRQESPRSRQGMMPIVGALAAVMLTSACSSVPDAVNPVAWVDAVTGSSETSEAEPASPPGADEQFPNLSRVDEQAAAKDNMSGGLTADTAGRQYADSIQRQQEAPQGSLYAEDKPPAAAEPEVAAAAPPPPTPQPVAPVATPSPAPSTTIAAAPAQSAGDDAAYSVDEGMRNRLAQQLAEIQARAADQGSLLPPDLTSGGIGQPTVIVSSGGIQTATPAATSLSTIPGVAGAGQVSNMGALPVPSTATRVATILFRNGSAALDARDREILNAVARLQKQNNGTLRVIGHASQRTANMDQMQHRATNLRVSVSRAEKVASALKGLGVAEGNILVAAVGDNEPIYAEVMPSGEAGNRRTEIFLSN